MKPCETCWSTLRNAIAVRGLERFVAKDGKTATIATSQRREPLMQAFMTATQLLIMHRGDKVHSLPPEACPFCLLAVDYSESGDEVHGDKTKLIETLADEVRKDFDKRGLTGVN